MKQSLKLIHWRLTSWRVLTSLLHAHFGYNDALTPVGLKMIDALLKEEANLMPIGRKKHWMEWIFKI